MKWRNACLFDIAGWLFIKKKITVYYYVSLSFLTVKTVKFLKNCTTPSFLPWDWKTMFVYIRKRIVILSCGVVRLIFCVEFFYAGSRRTTCEKRFSRQWPNRTMWLKKSPFCYYFRLGSRHPFYLVFTFVWSTTTLLLLFFFFWNNPTEKNTQRPNT